jgi:hypothetical protein
MKLNFLQRMGQVPSVKNLQLDTMDNDLRNGLWNVYMQDVVQYFASIDKLSEYGDFLWRFFYKLPIDERPNRGRLIEEIKADFFSYNPFEVYNFIEFHVSSDFYYSLQFDSHQFINHCNTVLEEEFSAFRFLERMLTPISNEVEIGEITEALTVGDGTFNTSYKGVNLHLKAALHFLSDKTKPDYRNSIKEAISAVETLCRALTNESILGKAINSFEKKGVKFNNEFKAGIEKLYAYTNNKESGIRHALIDSPVLPTFNEAKFMLVTCSGFINYLISVNN